MHTIDTILAFAVEKHSGPVSDTRRSLFARAIERGAGDKTLETLACAIRISVGKQIILPRHRFANLSRGKGWARKGSQKNAEWGERVEEGSGNICYMD